VRMLVRRSSCPVTTNARPSFIRRHWLKFLLVAIIIGLIAASPFLFVFIVESGNQQHRKLEERKPSEGLHEGDLSFDSTIWKRGFTDNFGIIYSPDTIRLRMVDDLLHRHRLRGMTREEVVSLLGTPPETNYFPDYDLVYWLGSKRYRGFDSAWWLAIKFGGDGRVSKTALVRD
jgi:hypothetical protein